MAARRNIPSSDAQLDLFSTQRPTHDTVDTIRPDGRETLARTPSEDGARTGTNGTLAPDASGGGGKDEGRNGHAANGFDATGINGAASPDAGCIFLSPFPKPASGLAVPLIPAASNSFAVWPFRPSSVPPLRGASGAGVPFVPVRAPSSVGVRASVSRPFCRIESMVSFVGLRVEKRSNC